MQLTITGYSTALFSTWYFIEELGLLFDAGDGFTSALLQKSRKVSHAFISHADRDHLTGLLQFNQLNARKGFPIIHFPKDCGSFPAIETFAKVFDPHVLGTVWRPLSHDDKVFIKDDLYVQSIKNGHVIVTDGVVKSLSYKVVRTKRKLKPELVHLSGEEIRRITLEQGKDGVTEEVSACILGYSGDTPVEDLARWNNCKVLIHEATFLGGDDEAALRMHGNQHSKLEEVISMISGLNIETLILGHFSSRYSEEQIDRAILDLCNKYAVNIPVFRVLPGHVVTDILNGQPLNK